MKFGLIRTHFEQFFAARLVATQIFARKLICTVKNDCFLSWTEIKVSNLLQIESLVDLCLILLETDFQIRSNLTLENTLC